MLKRTKSKRSRVPRNLSTVPHRFTRTCAFQFGVNSFQGFTSPSGATIYGNGVGFNYTLAAVNILGNLNSSSVAVPDSGEFTALFDQYRIVGVREKWVWSNNVTNASAAVGTLVGTVNPIVLSSFDRNGSAPPTSSTELMERDDTRYLTFDSTGPKLLSCRPVCDTVVGLGGASASALAQSASPWLNTNGTGVIYYGRKNWMMSQSSSPSQLQTGYLWVFFTLDFEFRTPQ